MNAKNRRRIEMGTRALEFSRAHPDASPGYAVALSRLEERLVRAEQLAEQQRNGITESRSASAQKRELRRMIRRTQLPHIARVAEAATKVMPDLARKFVLAPADTSYHTFRTAARGMAAEAQSRKDFLVNHGLADTVLDSLTEALDRFDRAVQQGTEGRREHVGARAELETVADEIVQVVRIMDGLNRFRFANNSEALAAWESASNIFGPVRSTAVKPPPAPGEPPSTGGEIAPAA